MRTLSYSFTPSLRRSGRRFSHRYHYNISICKRQRLKQDLCKKPKIRFDFWQSKRPSRSGRAGKPWENLLLVRGFLFVILILVVIIRLGLIEKFMVPQMYDLFRFGGSSVKDDEMGMQRMLQNFSGLFTEEQLHLFPY